MASQIFLTIVKNIHVLLISRVIEIHNKDMIMESFSSQLWIFEFKWLNFSFTFYEDLHQLKPLKIILLNQVARSLEVLQFLS